MFYLRQQRHSQHDNDDKDGSVRLSSVRLCLKLMMVVGVVLEEAT